MYGIFTVPTYIYPKDQPFIQVNIPFVPWILRVLAVGPARNFYFGLAIGLALLTGSLCSAKVSGACPLVRVCFFFKGYILVGKALGTFFVSFVWPVCILCITSFLCNCGCGDIFVNFKV